MMEKYLDKILVNTTNEEFDNHYIFLFGPYMCLTPGYETECDKIAKNNIVMQYILWCAYLLRKTAGMKTLDAANEVKWFINFIDGKYFKHDTIKNKFIDFAQAVFECCKRFNNGDEKSLENFIACAAPIVPYEGQLEKKDNEPDSCFEELYSSIDYESNNNTIEVVLIELLLDNMLDILANCNIAKDIDSNMSKTLTKLSMKNEVVSIGVQRYYLLAAIYFYKRIYSQEIPKFFNLLHSFNDLKVENDYSAFESMISDYMTAISTDAPINEYDGIELENKEQEVISKLTKSISHNKPTYKLDTINDFITVNRYMKFEEYPNRLFLGSLDNIKILNIINMGEDRNYYECCINDNDRSPFILCPFLDVRDLTAKILVYNVDYDKITIEKI